MVQFFHRKVHHEERVEHHNHQHTNWFWATAFALIALVAAAKAVDLDGLGDIGNQPKKIKWIGFAILCTFILAFIGFLIGTVLRHRFAGNMAECILAILTVGMWAAVLPAIMDVSTRGETGEIVNANLYVFPWLGLLAAINVLTGSMKSFFDRRNTVKSDRDTVTGDRNTVTGDRNTVTGERNTVRSERDDSNFLSWGALVATSLIVMASASRQYKDLQCGDDKTTMCSRLQYATWLGAIGGLVAFLWMMIDLCLPRRMGIVETILSILILTAWCIGVTFITFSEQAPAPTFSTLYFFSWGSFALAAGLVATSLYGMLGAGTHRDAHHAHDHHVETGVVTKSDAHHEKDHHMGTQEFGHTNVVDEERGRGAVVVEDEGIAAVPPTNSTQANYQVYK